MDKVIVKAKELKEEINSLPEVKEYLRLKEIYEKDDELRKMRLDIATLKSKGKEEERNNLLKIYNSHPLVANYLSAKEEVEEILLAIKNILD
ncbi:MAG: YlbF family regulator [Bacilli bacterium]|nr:YlbF family regulator [Bacilli bacterium]